MSAYLQRENLTMQLGKDQSTQLLDCVHKLDRLPISLRTKPERAIMQLEKSIDATTTDRIPISLCTKPKRAITGLEKLIDVCSYYDCAQKLMGLHSYQLHEMNFRYIFKPHPLGVRPHPFYVDHTPFSVQSS